MTALHPTLLLSSIWGILYTYIRTTHTQTYLLAHLLKNSTWATIMSTSSSPDMDGNGWVGSV